MSARNCSGCFARCSRLGQARECWRPSGLVFGVCAPTRSEREASDIRAVGIDGVDVPPIAIAGAPAVECQFAPVRDHVGQ